MKVVAPLSRRSPCNVLEPKQLLRENKVVAPSKLRGKKVKVGGRLKFRHRRPVGLKAVEPPEHRVGPWIRVPRYAANDERNALSLIIQAMPELNRLRTARKNNGSRILVLLSGMWNDEQEMVLQKSEWLHNRARVGLKMQTVSSQNFNPNTQVLAQVDLGYGDDVWANVLQFVHSQEFNADDLWRAAAESNNFVQDWLVDDTQCKI